MKATIALLAGFLMTTPALAQSTPVTPASLQPLHTGDSWTFDVQSPLGTARPDHVVEVGAQSGSWFNVKGYPFGDGYYRHYQSWLVLWMGWYEGVVDANAAPQGSWAVSAVHPCLNNATVTLVEDDATVTTPAGQFTGCRVYAVAGNCADAGLSGFTLAPGVGLIQFGESNIGGTVTYTLKRCSVGGAVYPKPEPLEVRLDVNKNTFRQNEQVAATLTLINNSRDVIGLEFQSSIELDVSLSPVSDPSRIDFLWSAHIRPIMVTHTTPWTPGSPLVYTKTFIPYSFQGSALQGEYILRVFTTSDRRYVGSTKVTFR